LFLVHFDNTFLFYSNEKECIEKLKYAVRNKPKKLSDEEVYELGWEAGTQRLITGSKIFFDNYKKEERDL